MEELAFIQKMMEALADESVLQFIDDVGFLVGVGIGMVLLMMGGTFLAAHGFAALAGKPHLGFGQALGGAIVVFAATSLAAITRLWFVDSPLWLQLLSMAVVVYFTLTIGNWLALQVNLAKAVKWGPVFGLLLTGPVLLLIFVLLPGSEARLAAAKANFEQIDSSQYGLAKETDSVEALERRMASQQGGQVPPSKVAMSVREEELAIAYEAIKERHARSKEWDEEETSSYRQILRRYTEAVEKLRQDKSAMLR